MKRYHVFPICRVREATDIVRFLQLAKINYNDFSDASILLQTVVEINSELCLISNHGKVVRGSTDPYLTITFGVNRGTLGRGIS